MAHGVRERVLLAAREQLREVASDVLAGAIDTLEERVLGDRRTGARARRDRPLERMREVLERDRALASAARPDTPTPPAEPAPASPPPAPAAVVCDEPIRTRSMAKLLAAQGYTDRALSIYAYLIAQPGSDPALPAEAAALREAQLRAAAATGES